MQKENQHMTRPIVHIVYLLVLLLGSQPLNGQRPGGGQRPPLPPGKGAIAGKLMDSSTDEAIAYANVLVYPSGDSVLLTGVTSRENGMFIVRPLDFGSYRIVVNYIGYEDLILEDVTISEESKMARLGPVRLFAGANQLTEVEVTAEREAIEFGLDKKVFNVEKNLGNVGGDALEVLKNIPSITLDTEGNVSLRGSQNVRILVNGKPSGLSGLDRRAILEQIPASTILRVEVLTNPSAKYDPEGTAGIINIVTKNQNKKGFNLTSQVNIGTRDKYNAAIGINQRVGKFNVFASYNYRYDDRFRAGARTRTNFFFDDPFILNQDFLGSRIR
ncbi:MAG: carboxypeptidase regulatory-like domain-containing protein, partial [Bacteroidota bacterium]